MNNKRLLTALAVVAAIGYMLWNPVTRPIIKFLLPLGSGWDDLLEIVLWVGLLGLLGYNTYVGWNKKKTFREIDRNRNTKVKQMTWVFLALIGSMIFIPGFADTAKRAVFYGKPVDLTFWITLMVVTAVTVIGWQIISYIDRRRSKK